ncbi:hypothetical protein TRFO_41824 [Tritrichomonas foetus]|uniref:Uncharacterized protein n=1 Tax=Tritrichomonas foetus TaxID=1144522 RepID=A0A1J4KZQ9_9EUKA|nr:hypothetical protein TRFO_41824 [Tritrichomonas foetus]|eukprot:OHT16352.1 hypothetical protein TRFO_41824 [Tritrichomonas foetus]
MIHGCDPGWILVDEYYEKNRTWTLPPLDEDDRAARIIYPILSRQNSNRKIRKHFDSFLY